MRAEIDRTNADTGFANLFGAFGYALAAVQFLFLTALFSTSLRGRMQGGLLVAATSANAP